MLNIGGLRVVEGLGSAPRLPSARRVRLPSLQRRSQRRRGPAEGVETVLGSAQGLTPSVAPRATPPLRGRKERLVDTALTSPTVITRLKWFVAGSVVTVGAGAYLSAKVKRARERLTPENLARASAVTVASVMNAAGRRMQRSGKPDEGESVVAGSG